MSVYIFGYQFGDEHEKVVSSLEDVAAHLYPSEEAIGDYLYCAEKWGFTPSTPNELASLILDPALSDYYFTCHDYPHGYPAEDTAYEDIGHFMLDETDLGNFLKENHLDYYFDFEQYGRDYIQNNDFQLGEYGYLASSPSIKINISDEEIQNLANYLNGYVYDQSTIEDTRRRINICALDESDASYYNPSNYWVVEFNETDSNVCSYAKRIVTKELIDSVLALDKRIADMDVGYLKLYIDHVQDGKVVDHHRFDIGDRDPASIQFLKSLQTHLDVPVIEMQRQLSQAQTHAQPHSLAEEMAAAKAAATKSSLNQEMPPIREQHGLRR